MMQLDNHSIEVTKREKWAEEIEESWRIIIRNFLHKNKVEDNWKYQWNCTAIWGGGYSDKKENILVEMFC